MKFGHHKQRGFTLVEIMIVVAIIALLAAIAVPNFLRARKRSQATRIINDLRMLDHAMDQYSIDTTKPSGFTPAFADLQNYLKTDTVLYSTGADIFGNSYGPFTVDSIPQVTDSAFNSLSDVADAGFWGQYYHQPDAGTPTSSPPSNSPAALNADTAPGALGAIQAFDDFMGSGGNPNSTQGQQLLAAAQAAYPALQAYQSSGQMSSQMQLQYSNATNYNYNNGTANTMSLIHP